MKRLAVATAVLALALSACGGLAAGASDDAIDCIAKALHDSDLSDDALQALVDGDEDYKGDKDDSEAMLDAVSDFQKCATG